MAERGSVHHIPKREREPVVINRTVCPSCGRNVPVRNNKIMLHPECDNTSEVSSG